MKAIKVVGSEELEVQDVPVPDVRDDYLFIKATYVAKNPIKLFDTMHVANGQPLIKAGMSCDYMPIAGATLGCDFAGVVEGVGSGVTKSWTKGDRVCGWVLGNVSRRSTTETAKQKVSCCMSCDFASLHTNATGLPIFRSANRALRCQPGKIVISLIPTTVLEARASKKRALKWGPVWLELTKE